MDNLRLLYLVLEVVVKKQYGVEKLVMEDYTYMANFEICLLMCFVASIRTIPVRQASKDIGYKFKSH